MAGRPKSFDQNQALEAFVDIFWTKGYQATSIDDLQEAAGIKRGSFYASFGSKDDVFASVLTRYWDEATERILHHLDDTGDPRAAIARFLNAAGDFMTTNTPRGCLLLSSSTDPACTQSADAAFLKKAIAALEARIGKAVAAVAEREGPDKAEALAAFVLTTLFGLNAMARTGQDADRIRAAAAMAAESVLNPIPE